MVAHFISVLMEKITERCWVLLIIPMLAQAAGTDFKITAVNPSGEISWTNAFASGVITLETTVQLNSTNGHPAWIPQQNYFTTDSVGLGSLSLTFSNGFFRLLALNFTTNTPQAFTNLAQPYGILHTITGNGGNAGYSDSGADVTNCWQPGLERSYATNASLSHPHFAMEGNFKIIFIQCRPRGNMHKTIDFIGDLKSDGCFKWHTPSHGVQKCQKAFIFGGFQAFSMGRL